MKKYQQYAPFLILILFLTSFVLDRKPVTLEWIGLVVLFIGIILLFNVIERRRKDRIEKWNIKRPSKSSYILKFSLYFGLPISFVISFLIYDKAEIHLLIMLITIPLLIIFGWIGYLEWKNCYEEYLRKKYE
ncbi:MAG: hypothetical protein STSR0008_22610 [Ignavibacterium sp.]